VREHWTHPPLVPREPPPAWRAAWRFRLVALLLLALLAAGTVQAVRVLTGATAQDPGIGAAPAPPAGVTAVVGTATPGGDRALVPA
jgi:hypothetical protein